MALLLRTKCSGLWAPHDVSSQPDPERVNRVEGGVESLPERSRMGICCFNCLHRISISNSYVANFGFRTLEKAFVPRFVSCANKVQTIEDSPDRPSYPVNGAATGVSSNRGRSKSSIARHRRRRSGNNAKPFKTLVKYFSRFSSQKRMSSPKTT